MFLRLLEKLPLSQNGKVAVGTLAILGICAIPVSRSKLLMLMYSTVTHISLLETKSGHDPFSSEKPQDVYDAENQRRRAQLSANHNG